MLLISTLSSTTVAFVWLFAVPGSIWPLFVFNLVGGIFWCANDAGMVNMQLSHTPSDNRTPALAVYAVFTSIAAAAALILGGAMLETLSPVMARLNLQFLGTPFDHYKLVFIIGIAIRYTVIAVFLPRVWNEKEMHFREAYSKLGTDFKAKIRYERSRLRLNFKKRK